MLPSNVGEVAAVVKAAKQAAVPIVPRGSGTGLAGGAVPAEGGIVLSLARLNRILKIDLENRIAIVEPGVINADVTKAVAKDGLFYAPDPSSQAACSIGGNVANNSGGPHTLAYGVTTNHVLGLEVVLDDGAVVWLGGEVSGHAGLRSLRSIRRLGRHHGNRHQSSGAADADARVGAHVTSHF